MRGGYPFLEKTLMCFGPGGLGVSLQDSNISLSVTCLIVQDVFYIILCNTSSFLLTQQWLKHLDNALHLAFGLEC